jgi:short-subunit dehydrogenase
MPHVAKSIVLTGASGDIGKEVARRLAARGARLALSARREESLVALARELDDLGGQTPTVLPADLAQPGEAARLARDAQDALGDIDILINNAGASMQGLSWVVGDRDEAREVFETNLWSPLALAAALAPKMVDRGRGAIVNIGSMVWVSPFPHLGLYASSRAALSAATQVMELELRPRGVRVLEVTLGPVDTPASRENRALVGAEQWLEGRPGMGTVASAAETITAAVEGDAKGVVFFPRMLRWPHRFPGLGRRYSRRVSKHADLTDTTVRFGGSTGHPDLLRLRDNPEPKVGE